MGKFQAMDLCHRVLCKSDYRSDPMVVLQPDDFAAKVEEMVRFWRNQKLVAEPKEVPLLQKLLQIEKDIGDKNRAGEYCSPTRVFESMPCGLSVSGCTVCAIGFEILNAVDIVS